LKSKNSKSILNYEQRVSAEFKALRLRIKKLESIVLGKQTNDSGYILDKIDNLNKG